MKVSDHASERMGERVGLNQSAAERLAAKALERGVAHKDLAGSAKRYVDKLYLSHGTANNIRIYGEHVYLFVGETLITVLALPHQYKAAVAKIRRRTT